MKNRLVLLFLCLLLALTGSFLQAQEGELIEYGQIVSGEITDDTFEIPFTIEGKKGDILVAEMRRDTTDSELYSPNLVILDSEGATLADGADYFSVGAGAGSIVAVELPDDGVYTVLATRDGGRSGDQVGTFSLKVVSAPLLADGEVVEGTISNEVYDQYYAVRGDGYLGVLYNNLGGNYRPAVSLNGLTDDGVPEAAAVLSGRELRQGVAAVDAEAGALYLVMVTASEFDYLFNEVEASYELTLFTKELKN